VRLVAEYWPLASQLPLSVRNVTGSNRHHRAREVLTARPDGYTLLPRTESRITSSIWGKHRSTGLTSSGWRLFFPTGARRHARKIGPGAT